MIDIKRSIFTLTVLIAYKLTLIASILDEHCNAGKLQIYQIGESYELSPTKPLDAPFSIEDVIKEMNSETYYKDPENLDEKRREKLLSGGKFFEGDILMDSNYSLHKLFDEDQALFGSDSWIAIPWPEATIHFAFQDNFTFSEQMAVALAMDEIQSVSCVKFKMKNKEEDYLKFYKSDGCASHVGFKRGVQGLSLSDDCLKSHSIILHLLMHALGFWHETSRPDRDAFIKIHWDNVDPDYSCSYRKFSSWPEDTVLQYDPKSILHYSRTSFSKNDLKPAFTFIGDAQIQNDYHTKRPMKLSELDAKKIIQKYDCFSRNYQEISINQIPEKYPEQKSIEDGDMDYEYENEVDDEADYDFFRVQEEELKEEQSMPGLEVGRSLASKDEPYVGWGRVAARRKQTDFSGRTSVVEIASIGARSQKDTHNLSILFSIVTYISFSKYYFNYLN